MFARLKSQMALPCTVDLSTLAVIKVTGEDAQTFLQGQLSNDVTLLADNAEIKHFQLTAYCNSKGRTFSVIRLVRHRHEYWMIVPAAVAETLLARLKIFVLRARVKIEEKPEIALLGVIGETNEKPNDHITRIVIDGITPRQILLGETAVLQTYQHQHRANDDWWRLHDILSGIPQIYPQTIEAFVPQMINLDLVGGVSFTKGCYSGQEIISRLRHLGKLKQRMLAGIVDQVETISPGDKIYLEQNEQKVGVIVDAVKITDHQYIFSSTAPADPSQHGRLRVGSPSGPAPELITLPYNCALPLRP